MDIHTLVSAIESLEKDLHIMLVTARGPNMERHSLYLTGKITGLQGAIDTLKALLEGETQLRALDHMFDDSLPEQLEGLSCTNS
jgi:hypothetical protein